MLRNSHIRITLAFLALLFALSPAQAKRDKLLDLSFQGPQLFSYERLQNGTARVTSQVPRLLGVPAANVLLETYAGYSSAGDLLDMSGNGRDLADAGTAPTIVNASLMGGDGNQLQAYSYPGTDGRHQLAHADWMNIFDGVHTVTVLVRSPASAPAANMTILSHRLLGSSGVYFYISTGGSFYATYGKVGSSTSVGSTVFLDGNWHVVHYVRTSNGFVTVYVDGVPSAPTDCSTFGEDVTTPLYVGSFDGPALPFSGPIAYTRLQDSALTYAQVQKENDLFKGILGSRAPFQYASPTFQRSTVSYGSRATGSTPLYQVPANWPVKTSDGGMLVEASFSQLYSYTGTFYSSGGLPWTFVRSSLAATSVVLPDGTTGTTNTLHEDATAANSHNLEYIYSATTGTSYCASYYVKYNGSAGTPREWVRLAVSDGTNSKAMYFNVRYGYMGTASGALTGGHGIKPVGNNWYRIWVWATAGATSAAAFTVLYVAESDGDVTFNGQNQDSVFISHPQLQTGAFPTGYYPQPAAAGAVRSADNLTYIPWRISKDLRAKVNATPRLLFLGNESLAGSTVTPTVGSYSFTKNGRPQNDETYAEGASFKMNGTSDSLSILSASAGDFLPSGSFSVVATFTPFNVTTGNAIMGRYTAAGNQRAWVLTQNATAMNFTISLNGTDTYNAQVANCLEIGKPVLVTGTYNSASGLTVRVDAFTAGTQAVTGQVHPTNTADLYVANHGSSAPLNGKLHYLAYYDNYVVSQAEHDAMYNDWKSDGILPLNISSTAAKTKLVVECEVKAQFASATDNGAQYRSFLAIGGQYGTSSTTRNNFYLQATANASSYAVLHTDDSVTDRYIYSAVRTDHDKWTRHKWVVDTADLANSTYHINGVAQGGFTQMSGTAEFGLRDTLIRIGQGSTGSSILGNMEIRNVKLGVE